METHNSGGSFHATGKTRSLSTTKVEERHSFLRMRKIFLHVAHKFLSVLLIETEAEVLTLPSSTLIV
jgi:hypothetical protein